MAERLKFENEETVELGTFEGDVEIKRCRHLIPQQGSEIVITGTLYVQGELEIDGSLRARNLDAKTRDRIVVNGDLTIEESAVVNRGTLEVTGSAKARMIEAGSSLRVGKELSCDSG
jgi:cytoskeletal protein CcmA (bactofilin family)